MEVADDTVIGHIQRDDQCDAEQSRDSESAPLQTIPLKDLPPLPTRGDGYHSEPQSGICIVLVMSAVLVGVTHAAVAMDGPDKAEPFKCFWVQLIWAEAVTAVLCMLFLLCGQAGVIHRSNKTCYPIPEDVEEKLRAGCSGSTGLGSNRAGPPGSATLGTYCVRCLVWRPPMDASHHCSVCQRCVVGFDHHCDVFGRCIVRGNMICFIILIGMMCAGMITAMVAVAVVVGDQSLPEAKGGS